MMEEFYVKAPSSHHHLQYHPLGRARWWITCNARVEYPVSRGVRKKLRRAAPVNGSDVVGGIFLLSLIDADRPSGACMSTIED